MQDDLPGRAGAPRSGGERTGRYLVTFPAGAGAAVTDALRAQAGLSQVASADEVRGTGGEPGGDPPEVLLLERLSAAVLSGDPDRMAAVEQADLPVSRREPERWVYRATPTGPPPADPPAGAVELGAYLRGYGDGVAALVARLTGEAAGTPADGVESSATWGVEAVGAPGSRWTGQGVRVAVLDTGLDAEHPDVGGLAPAARSFVPGEGPDDVQGHGTHVAGTLCGPSDPDGVRYGVAPGVELLVGKVLGDDGRGREGDVLAGIDWAVEQGCRVVSMSLGSRPVPGEHYSEVFEQVAAQLLAASPGVVLVAAAGNESARARGLVAPVGRPASSPSVLAVAAVDRVLRVADFSNASAGTEGGQVDLAGPGVDVLSAWPLPERYARHSGTSMATPHVSGVLALWLEARPGARAAEVVGELLRTARRLDAPSVDVGAGLVQAPA